MQKAYIDWRNFKKYFNYLIEEDFIRESNPDENHFVLTEKVNELLN